jgi:hypothetical protein
MTGQLHRRHWLLRAAFLAAIGFVSTWSLAVETRSWPQEVKAPQGSIVVYQPQPESLKGNVLTGRAAMSLELKNRKEPIFGAFWFTAIVDTDGDDDVATLRDLQVTKVRWPESKDTEEQRFTKIVNDAVPKSGFRISMKRLSASLATAAQEEKSLADLKNEPPKIVFSEQLAVLLLYDGTPRFSPVEKSDYERAVNTPFAVVRNTKTKVVYLSSGPLWYQAQDPRGPWAQTKSPPADLIKLLPPVDMMQPVPAKVPAIIVATEPTELIATDGKANWKALPGGKLLYVSNTESPWVRESTGADMYVLLSGRWFRAASQSGPWTFVRADKLPASFKEIPPASDIGGLRVSVAGTPEAEEALLDAQIPQTAAIKRSEAKLEVQYDGAPKFEKIPGTAVSYAVNTGAQVLEIGGAYYAVDKGVWFKSASATGPWSVADKIPNEEIQKIPPSSPVYNTTYVYVYQSTPEVVYVGYTPGYMWSYPYYGVPVYGTGWYYPPYYMGGIYYPRPPTWGFHVGYNPWTGWSYGVSWSNGFFSMGVSWGGGYGGGYPPGGWYGGGYRGPVVIHHSGDINIGNTVNTGDRAKVEHRMQNDKTFGGDRLAKDNVYKRPEARARNADRATAQKDMGQARPATGRANDVFADKNGDVARRTGDQWQTRDAGKWKPEQGTGSAAMQNTRPSAQQRPSVDRGELNRASQARNAGAARERAQPARRGGGGGGRRR